MKLLMTMALILASQQAISKELSTETAIKKPVSEQVDSTIRRTVDADAAQVVGRRHAPQKLDFLTRMPIKAGEGVQTISIIPKDVIVKQGAMTLGDAVRNVAGVTMFATYGGASESLTTRGFRGIPVLKNGVRLHSDFRGQGSLTDMQGVETIQVVKGSAAVSQGIGNDLGSAGGTVNIATKTPHFANSAEIGLRLGSWWQVRPTFDLQYTPKSSKVALRLNGALEHTGNYRKYVTKDRLYINPSLAWRISDKTMLIAELDYLHDSRTPDRGTVNLAPDSIDALYNMPNDKFLGFKTDRVFTNQTTYSARLNHRFNSKFSLRAAIVGSSLTTDNTGASTSKLYKNHDYNMLARSLGRSQRNDQNQVIQLDFIGQELKTGKIKHTFQVGLDFRRSQVGTTSYKSMVVDTINVLEDFTNQLPNNIGSLKQSGTTSSVSYNYGIMAQYAVTFNKYIKTIIGGRYSYGNSTDNTSTGAVSGDAFNPTIGLIITPFNNFHLFGSYSTTTDLRSAANLRTDGSPIGASTTIQFETGIKSSYLAHRLHFNLTLFNMLNKNLAYQVYDNAGQTTGHYEQAGNLLRRGVEVEVTGSPVKGLQLILGYAFLDAQYQDSPAYVDGSAPMNAPKHSANAWAYYTTPFGLTVGIGAYYVGERPVGDYSKKTTHQNTTPSVQPFNMKAYTTLNATVGYNFLRATINLTFNNILNATGYSSYYRGGYINPIDPFNFSATFAYRF